MSRMPKQLVPETKRIIDNTWTAETMDDYKTGASVVYQFSVCGEGNDYNQRVADKIFSKGIYFNLHFEGSSGSTFQNVRLDLVEDNEPAATFPGFTDIYYTNGSALTLTDALNVPVNPLNIGRFRIRKTFRFPLNSWESSFAVGGAGVASVGVKNIKFYFKTNRVLRYSGSGSAQPTWGRRWMLWAWSDVSSNTPKVWATIIHRFVDI